MSENFLPKLKAAYENGRLDYLAGAGFDPKTPLVVYGNLSKIEQACVMVAWTDGWADEERRNRL